jgi:SAM-dependent methyltransferase
MRQKDCRNLEIRNSSLSRSDTSYSLSFPYKSRLPKTSGDSRFRIMGRDWLLFPRKRQREWIEQVFRYWREHGFPYIEMTEQEIESELSCLIRTKLDGFVNGYLSVSMVGLRLANFFHPQMWHVPVHDYKTVFERFQDDFCLKDCVEKAFRFFPNRNSTNGQCLRSTLRIYRGTTRVSNFRPTVALNLCARYSTSGATVLDFSAGYGGRLLGCMALPRKYIGIEPCSFQVEGLARMLARLNRRLPGIATVIPGCAEDVLCNFKRSSVDLVLSSPPYFNHERYSTEQTQSYLRYPTYTEWRRRFLKKVICGTHRVLKPAGVFVLNIADPPGIPLVHDTLLMCADLFVLHDTLRMPLYRLPLQRNITNEAFKFESIFVFKKRR